MNVLKKYLTLKRICVALAMVLLIGGIYLAYVYSNRLAMQSCLSSIAESIRTKSSFLPEEFRSRLRQNIPQKTSVPIFDEDYHSIVVIIETSTFGDCQKMIRIKNDMLYDKWGGEIEIMLYCDEQMKLRPIFFSRGLDHISGTWDDIVFPQYLTRSELAEQQNAAFNHNRVE